MIASLRAPDAEKCRWHKEWTAIGIERKARQIWLLLEAESNEMADWALISVMGPDEALPGQRAEGGKSFPIPRHRADGLGKNLLHARGADLGHQPAAGTPGPFTWVRMN